MSHVFIASDIAAIRRWTIAAQIMVNVASSRLARKSSGFADALAGNEFANDWLSVTASDIYRTRRAHDEAAAYDAGFDAGEFSGPAHAQMENDEVERIEAHFFNYTGATFTHAVRCRISEGCAHRLGF